MPGRDPGGLIVTILLGIAGSVIGGYIGRSLFYSGSDGAGGLSEPGFLMSLIFAVIGALILLAGYRLIRGRSMRS
jgi:uncharacterized membrane protein YeaQ/YmgE (transglycosylase-associated protein family)